MSKLNISAKHIMRMILCVDEAAANIIEHCHESKNNEIVTHFNIDASFEDGFITFTFRDNGLPYDPTTTPPVDLKAHIAAGKKDGLGVHIMRTSLDVFTYDRVEDENIFTIGMKVSPRKT